MSYDPEFATIPIKPSSLPDGPRRVNLWRPLLIGLVPALVVWCIASPLLLRSNLTADDARRLAAASTQGKVDIAFHLDVAIDSIRGQAERGGHYFWAAYGQKPPGFYEQLGAALTARGFKVEQKPPPYEGLDVNW